MSIRATTHNESTNTKAPIVTVVGSSNVDLICQVPHLPKPGQTITGGKLSQAMGGKGANQAVAAARAQAHVNFITRLGQDAYGKAMSEALRQEGIAVFPPEPVEDQPTGTAMILLDGAGENCIAVAPGANDWLTADDITACTPMIRDSTVLLMQMEVPPTTVATALTLAKQHNVFTILNYAPVRAKDITLGEEISLLIVNETEAAELAGLEQIDHTNAPHAIDRLRTAGIDSVALTLGAAGVMIGSPGFCGLVPGFDVTPVDTTGAGDTFCGAVAAELARGATIEQAARFGCAAAAIAITAIGAQTAIPRYDEVRDFLETHR